MKLNKYWRRHDRSSKIRVTSARTILVLTMFQLLWRRRCLRVIHLAERELSQRAAQFSKAFGRHLREPSRRATSMPFSKYFGRRYTTPGPYQVPGTTLFRSITNVWIQSLFTNGLHI